jgi:hypothetical protein
LPGYPGINIFLSKEHVMKRHLFPLLILALILPALAGCPQDSGDSTPGGNLGDGDLVLKGKVYTGDLDYTTLKQTYEPSDANGTVEVMAWYPGAGYEKLIEGPLTNGEFDISIAQPANPVLLDDNALASLFSSWDNPTADLADAKIVQIYLRLAGDNSIEKSKSTVSGTVSSFKMTQESVMYLYVDKDVTITLVAKEQSGTDEEDGTPYTNTYKAATLKFTQGWNALYVEQEMSGTSTTRSRTVTLSMKNPDLYWVLNN